MSMWDALRKVEERHAELNRLLADPDVTRDPRRLRDLARERAALDQTMAALADYRRVEATPSSPIWRAPSCRSSRPGSPRSRPASRSCCCRAIPTMTRT